MLGLDQHSKALEQEHSEQRISCGPLAASRLSKSTCYMTSGTSISGCIFTRHEAGGDYSYHLLGRA